MKISIFFLLSAILTLNLAHAESNKALIYSGTVVTMTADPEVTWDENPHQYTALKLSKPKNIRGNSIDDDSGKLFLNVAYMQLVDSKKLAKKYKNKGKVNIGCSEVYEAHTGYHYTDLLCVVSTIKLSNSKNVTD